MRMVIVAALALSGLVALTTASAYSQDKKAPTLEDDLKALEGGIWWRSPKAGFGFIFQGPSEKSPKKTASFLIGIPGDFTSGGLSFDLTEDEKKRYIVFGEDPLNKLFGRRILYKLDGKVLTLVVEEGEMKGEYKLEKKAK